MVNFLYLILYIGFCIGFAYINSLWIKKGKHIYHLLNGVIDLVVFSLLLYLSNSAHLGAEMIIGGRLFFDTALNLFRKLPLNYVPEDPKSLIDKAEKFVFELIYSLYRLLSKKIKPSGFPCDFPVDYPSKSASYKFTVGLLPKIVYLLAIVILVIR